MEDNKAAAQQQGQDNNKEKKKFEDSLRLLHGILAGTPDGEKLLKKKRAKTNLIDEVVGELMTDSDKEFKASLKTKVQNLIKGYMTYQEETAKKKKEFEKADAEAMKRFTETAQQLVQDVENRQEVAARTKQAVIAVGEAASTTSTDEELEEEQA